MGSFPSVMDKMKDHFKDFGLHKGDDNDFSFGDDLDIG